MKPVLAIGDQMIDFITLNKELFGSTLEGVYFSEDGSYMKIQTDKDAYCFDTEGDCCSHTYYHEVFGVPEGNILEVEDVDMPDLKDGDEDKNDELVQQYGINIKTTKGVITIVYRNSSNGYYGGSSSLIDSAPSVKWKKQTGKD